MAALVAAIAGGAALVAATAGGAALVAAQLSGRDKRDRSRWEAVGTDVRAPPTRKPIGNVRDTCAFHRCIHLWKSSGGHVAGEQKKCKWSGMITYLPTIQSRTACQAFIIHACASSFARMGNLLSTVTVTNRITERLSWYVITELRDG